MLLLAACGMSSSSATGSQQPTTVGTTAAATPAALTADGRFTSQRLGWSMVIPAGWAIRPATADWPSEDTFPLPGAAYTDNFERPGGFPVIDISTRALNADESSEELLAGISAGSDAIGCTAESESEIVLDGEMARFQRQLCANQREVVFEVVAFHADQVWVIYWLSLAADEGTAEEDFREALWTFRFPD
ncbi:MAG TPA: hypothetical protein VFK61_06915 [Candidatus Limnocylindria bacterium]|nr:hypothetical protein [Candidatus Limnocylindria bacterium]